jgi:hypothetical protein
MGPKVYSHYITWDPSEDLSVSGYYLYWGNQSGIYSNYNPIEKNAQAGSHPAPSVDLLALIPEQGTYFFVVTARDAYMNESDFSNEVSWVFIILDSPMDFEIP